MGLNFRNSTNAPVYVAYAYPNSGCGPVNYAKIGWYRIDPGQSRQVWSGYAGGRTFYYYAEDASRNRVWSGSYFTQLPTQAFHWCWNTGCTTCRNLGMRRVYVSVIYANFTINLVTSSSQGKSKAGNVRLALPTKQKPGERVLRKIPKVFAGKIGKGKPILVNRSKLPKK